MPEIFETFEAVDKVIIATNGYLHYYGTTTTSANNSHVFTSFSLLTQSDLNTPTNQIQLLSIFYTLPIHGAANKEKIRSKF